MANSDEDLEPGVFQYLFLAFMLLTTFYLIVLYIKLEELRDYPCYNIIIMSLVIFVGDIINIFIPNHLGNDYSQFIWGFLKDFFNKMIMTILTMQAIVMYLGVAKNDFYAAKEKYIFIFGLIVSAGVSAIISAVFNSVKVYDGQYYEYLNNYNKIKDNEISGGLETRLYSIIIIEMIFCVVMFIISVFCLIKVLICISEKKELVKKGQIEDELGYSRWFIRTLIIFFLNIIAIVSSSILLTFDVFNPKINQSIYLGVCFLIDLCYSMNGTVIKGTQKLFCKKGESDSTLKRRGTFELKDKPGKNDDEEEDD